MSQTAAPFVYTGPWINWSRGPVLGSTITLEERDADLLIAFLGIFVTVTGAACWKIMAFTLHQLRSSHHARDGIHHQQQAIFRNTGSPLEASFELAQLSWSWRKHALRPFIRTLPLLALALSNFFLFGVAGIFSSEVAKAAGNETLIRSSDCGSLNFTDGNVGTPQGLAAFMSIDVNDTLSATTYSRACYGNVQNPLECARYPQTQLQWKVNQNATCPFSNGLCIDGDSSAYEMDTGLIDSHRALGINAPESERVQYRKVTTCSPIHTKGYVNIVNDSDSSQIANGNYTAQYLYGPLPTVSNYTWQYNTVNLVAGIGYTLQSLAYFAGGAKNAWYPIDALNRTDADVSLFLLAPNSVSYEAPITDPFYLATTQFSLNDTDFLSNLTYYTSDRLVNALACTDQHQYCNPTNKQCTALNSSSLTHKALNENKVGFNEAQLVTMLRIDFLTQLLTTYLSVNSRGAYALRAYETLDSLVNIALPNNQWMTEVSTWFAVSMAKLQQKVIQYATGPGYVPEGMVLSRPVKLEEKQCKSQISRSAAGTTSFSVLGVAIILIVGALLIPTSLILPSAVGFLRQLLGRKQYKSLQWIVDSKFQLQRLAFEEAGQGSWSGGADSVPLTRKDEVLGLPEGVDTKHPRLGRPMRDSESGTSETPENESLMGDKGMRYRDHGIPN